jgi:hypothetical protein
MHQYSAAVNNGRLDNVEVTIGTAPLLRFFTGAPPANCAAASTGTQLASQALPSDWAQAASAQQKLKSVAAWTGTFSATGVVGYYRLFDNAGAVCHEQGTVTAQVQIATNALTAVNGNVLNFASTTGVAVGMNVSGTGIPAGAEVVALTGTTVTLSRTSTAGVASAATITFGGDMTIDNVNAASGQAWTVNTFTKIASNQ